jgi:hypothetical protein
MRFVTLLNVQFIAIVSARALNQCQVITNERMTSYRTQPEILLPRVFVRTYDDVIHLVYVV